MFSKVDLVWGYHQMPVAEKDVPKVQIFTHAIWPKKCCSDFSKTNG